MAISIKKDMDIYHLISKYSPNSMQSKKLYTLPNTKQPVFIPTTILEAKNFGWTSFDVVIITGDAYIDHPSFGAALIGRLLIATGFSVGIISQPDWKNPQSLRKLGKPQICFAITAGNLDSMLKLYSAARRLRKYDDYTENGRTGLCPPMATIVYANLARQAYPGTKIILGGIEASLRRIAHYDYWQDKIRASILCESKADILVYGMGEKTIVNIISNLKKNLPLSGIKGTARLAGANESKQIDHSKFKIPPSFEEIKSNPDELLRSFTILENEMNPFNAKALIQKYNERSLIVEAPQLPLSQEEIDTIYDLPFAYAPHPSYKGTITAYEMIKHSITAHRGCPGACSFCSISLHQGKFLQSRSIESILCEIRKLVKKDFFRGTISDIGGPTANCYASSQKNDEQCRNCRRPSCLFPEICKNFLINQNTFIKLLDMALNINGVKHLFIGSGLRTDLAIRQAELMAKIIAKHVSGQLKIAPEHIDDKVLKLMRKNRADDFFKFIQIFEEESRKAGKKQYLVPYFISNFPGSGEEEFKKVSDFLRNSRWQLQQVQDFIPLPMTIASAFYYCGKDLDGKTLHINKGLKERRPQMRELKSPR